MADALIGRTGFIGGNLAAQTRFDDFYNSANIEAIAGKSYGTIVCAGAPAEKWKANRYPEEDAGVLRRLMDNLGRARANRLVLVSTVDVYPDPVGVDEDSPIDMEKASAYGKHRRELEVFVQSRFKTLIVRLPGVFGLGLKKNVIYDLMNRSHLEAIRGDAVYQFYFVGRLWQDMGTCLRHRLETVNFATEPIKTSDLAREAFGVEAPPGEGLAARYDFRSKHFRIFGGKDGYLYSKETVLADLKAYLARALGPKA